MITKKEMENSNEFEQYQCYFIDKCILNLIYLFKQEHQQQDEVLSKEARMARVHRVASELLSTEEQYVTVLYLIDQVGPCYCTYT